MKKIALCIFAFIAGCMPADAISQHATTNPNITVELLFSHEGCDVFRFRDLGFHYYVRCAGPPTQDVQTKQQVSCGKNCSREEAIQTVTSPAR